MVNLSEAEKEKMARHLSGRAWAGGWFFVAMAALLLVLMAVALINRSPDLPRFTGEDYVPMATLLLGLLGTAVWLLRRRWVIRGWLDEPLRLGSGRIVGLQQLPYSGYRLELKIVDGGAEMRVGIGFLGSPSWQVGEDLPLIFWENGRFCPRHFDHIVDVAYLPTPERRRSRRRRIIIWTVIYLLLVTMAILMGLYGQGRL